MIIAAQNATTLSSIESIAQVRRRSGCGTGIASSSTRSGFTGLVHWSGSLETGACQVDCGWCQDPPMDESVSPACAGRTLNH
eukprot:4720098-Pleurochrysis_carterae.AAC.2